MKILLIHNFYQLAGGEDAVVKNEKELLQKFGNSVVLYTVDNKEISSAFAKIFLAFGAIYSFSQYRKLCKTLEIEKPDVVHVHNYFPILSPSIFYACNKIGVPVVHTLHNYRAVCPSTLLMHDGKINERSVNGSSWWAVLKKVYRGSIAGTLALVCMVELHKKLGTWQKKVDSFIALTEFSKDKYRQAGWPIEKLLVKPNFIEDPIDSSSSQIKVGGYGVYVGRLSSDKGIDILLNAWSNVDFPLKVVGDGPLSNSVQKSTNKAIEYLGAKAKTEVIDLIMNADFIVMASTWYEGFPMVLVEAFACGTCAIVPKLGSMTEIIDDGSTGLHFEAGNEADLAKKIEWMIANPEKSKLMGENARLEYLQKYTPENNYKTLVSIYNAAQQEAKKNA